MPDWPQIVQAEGPAVWRVADRLLGNRADADECFQEVFLAALEVARREPVRCWHALLVRLAANRAMSRFRRRRRRADRERPADCDLLPALAPEPSQDAPDAELADRLRAALAELPAPQAEAFYLHGIEGWSYCSATAELEGEAPAEPRSPDRLGRSLALPLRCGGTIVRRGEVSRCRPGRTSLPAGIRFG